MATLAESFLADLDDLSDDGEAEDVPANEADAANVANATTAGAGGDPAAAAFFLGKDVSEVSQLSGSDEYKALLQKVAEASKGKAVARAWTGPATEDPAYRLVLDCNETALEIENEVVNLHTFARGKYKPKFPELETLVHHPVDYARVVKKIGNETDLTAVDLEGLLPSATIMVVSVTASTTSGKPLAEAELQQCLAACEAILAYEDDKAALLKFVEGRMEATAPNLSAVLGPECASKLMGVAGGLVKLSKIPACNVQLLGAKKKHLAGFSTSTNQQHQGYISACPLVMGTPPFLRKKACRLIAGKCVLMARVDAYGKDPEGKAGREQRDQIAARIDKWQEPPPARIIKPLAVPDSQPKKRRGGRRLRKQKERYGMTEMRRQQNRVNFNTAEEEIMDGEDTVGLGLIGQGGAGGMGKLRLQVSNKKQKLSKQAEKKLQQQRKRGRLVGAAAASGMASSLAFTPIQGIELVNPLNRIQQQQDTRSGTESYFA